MSATGVMTGARMSYDAAMTAARGAATSLDKITYVVRDNGQGRNPVAFHVTSEKPYGGRYTLIQEFNPTKPPPDGQAPWYMGDKAPEPPMPATSKAVVMLVGVERDVQSVEDLSEMIETLVQEFTSIGERQPLIDIRGIVDALNSAMDACYTSTFGLLPEDDE